MLSILPKHVADEMLKDMKKDESQKDQQQFNTMYMYRHENVRCARHGPGLPGQHGAGPRGVGVAPQAREVPADWEPGHPPRSVHPGRERPCRGLPRPRRTLGCAVQPTCCTDVARSGDVTSAGPPSPSEPAVGLNATLLPGRMPPS